MFNARELNIPLTFPVNKGEVFLRYVIAIAATAVTGVVTYFLWPFISPTVSLLFFVAVLFSSWYCGLRPALVCALLSTIVCKYLLVVPASSFSIGADDLLRLVVFMLAAVFVSTLTMAHTQLEATAARMKKELAVTLKSIGDAVITTDARGRVTLMNSVAQSLTGWTEAEARGRLLREIFQIVDHKTREGVDGVVGRVIRDNAVIALGSSVLMVTRDGSEIPVTEIATPLRDPDGNMNGVVLVLRTASNSSAEKTDRQLLTEKLALLGSVDVPMFALDHEGKCLFITKAATALLGYHSEELVGREVHEIIRTRNADETDEGRVQFFGESYPAAASGTLLRRNGLSTPVELSIAPILMGDNVLGTVVTIADLTQHHRAEEAVLKFEAIVDSLEDAVVVHTPDGIVTSWSASAESLFGYTKEEVMGRHVSIVHAPGRKRELGDLFLKVVRRAKVEPFETVRIGKGGEQIDVCIRVGALTNPMGEVIGVSQIIKDIRQEKTRKENLVRAESSQAYDYNPPRSPVENFVERGAETIRAPRPSARPQAARHGNNNALPPAVIVGRSPVMQKLFSTVERIAPTESSVLITGATGTGKELIARTIHQQSLRANGPFVDINCSAIPETLIEAELFGHQKGTFTGAHEHRAGLFEVAAGGTLFLDEVDALNLSAQAKLLRVIQERRVRRIGGRVNIDVDVRIIAATNSDLSLAINDSRFRADLFYRLRVVPIHIPELYQREGDIELLIDFFLKRQAERTGTPMRRFTAEAMQVLLDYPWPGNVRELENAIEYALAMATDENLGIESLPSNFTDAQMQQDAGDLKQVLQAYMDDNVSLAEIEKRYILSVLQQFGGNQVKAAAALGIDRSKLYRRLKQYGVIAVKFLQEEQDGLQLRSWSKDAVNTS